MRSECVILRWTNRILRGHDKELTANTPVVLFVWDGSTVNQTVCVTFSKQRKRYKRDPRRKKKLGRRSETEMRLGMEGGGRSGCGYITYASAASSVSLHVATPALSNFVTRRLDSLNILNFYPPCQPRPCLPCMRGRSSKPTLFAAREPTSGELYTRNGHRLSLQSTGRVWCYGADFSTGYWYPSQFIWQALSRQIATTYVKSW